MARVPSTEMLFGLSIMVTLALLAALVTTGLMRERRLHLIVFFPTTASLLSAIYLAEKLGQAHRFSPTLLSVHLPIAISTVVVLLPTIATGILRWNKPSYVRPHRYCVIAFLALAVLALGTGLLLLLGPHQDV